MSKYQRGFAIEAVLGVMAILTILGGATYVAKEEGITQAPQDPAVTDGQTATDTPIASTTPDATLDVQTEASVSL